MHAIISTNAKGTHVKVQYTTYDV